MQLKAEQKVIWQFSEANSVAPKMDPNFIKVNIIRNSPQSR